MDEPVVRSRVEADVLAMLATVALGAMPIGGERRAVALELRTRARRAAATGEGLAFTPESDEPAEGDSWATAEQAAIVTGLSPQAITARCRSGAIPGAIKHAGRWLIPSHALPEPEEDPEP